MIHTLSDSAFNLPLTMTDHTPRGTHNHLLIRLNNHCDLQHLSSTSFRPSRGFAPATDNHCALQHPVSSTMGAVTTELVRWVWAAQKPPMGPLWRCAPRSAQPRPPLAHTVPVCSLGCFPGVCSVQADSSRAGCGRANSVKDISSVHGHGLVWSPAGRPEESR